ncbi:MAG: LysR family transcriptional regulator, partial [Gammaproteobacteria bacterium]|nr:LysR family transcriptional regulator [Gammaproteobacteria bacterium]
LEVRLFDRMPSGYAMTPAGEAMLRTADRVEEEISALERELTGQDTRLVGTLRVTTTDTLALKLLGPALAEFRTRYCGIAIELVIDNAFFSLTKREADIAIRPTSEPPENLIGRKVCDVATAIYGSLDYRKKNTSRALNKHQWVLPDESLSHLASARWLSKRYPDAAAVLKCNSLVGLHEAVRCGIGIAPLPCFIGDADDSLTRIRAPIPELATALWILIHPDLRRTARMLAFMDFMSTDFRHHQDLLEGRR